MGGGWGGCKAEQILHKWIIKRGDGGAIEMWSTYNLKYLEALKQKWHMIPFVAKANGKQNNEGNVSIFTIREGVKKNVFFGTLSQTSDPTHPPRTFRTPLSENKKSSLFCFLGHLEHFIFLKK